ncbi:hypothetical protein P7M46_07445 [Bisgaard Taxon 10/6]|uniref:hypothetical protein n=1 Tax=Exercitatus varius TaxID=67857 RepID=UPI00294B0BA1|nr:hypothetical protein [Exercitatus varius]MDG2917838.1 hypothetical protein [Exercitatus varius]
MNEQEIKTEPLIITQKLVYPHFSINYDEEWDSFYSKFHLDKNKLFCDETADEALDVLLTGIALKQISCGVPLLVTKEDLDLIYSLRLPNPIINLDEQYQALQ